MVSVYNKLQEIETHTSAELVRYSARKFTPLIEQVGGVAAALVTLHTKATVPEAPLEVTVTVEVPVEPRLIADGVIAPTATVNLGSSGLNFTTKASRQVPQFLTMVP